MTSFIWDALRSGLMCFAFIVCGALLERHGVNWGSFGCAAFGAWLSADLRR